ncbi:MAG: para-aminobenzoate synthase, subunit [Acidobacteria bacterium]|nr:para-aminobenzoate synthase, subunit [Acidobacteriota bacterium]
MVRVIFGQTNAATTHDDWRLHSESPTRVLCAHKIEEVLPLLNAVDEAATSGAWAVVMLSYEAAPAFDRAFEAHPPDDFPVAWAAIFDDLDTVPLQDSTEHFKTGAWRPLVERTQFDAAIKGIRERIATGHTYQVNYTFPSVCDFEGNALAWYRKLSAAQNAGYSVYLDLGRFQVLCFSPELFFARKGNRLTTRPMKGTGERGRWLAEDRQFAKRLYQSEKDRAENVMIVDLLRNDLGKISKPGSVQVTKLFALERYNTMWQMTSTVESEINPQTGLAELIRALFPCGSITGAPKIRTMKIIRELEPFPRRVFTGTIGLVRPGGDCCFNVAIRTVVLDSASGQATFGVGGGITFGSTPQGEYAECLVKAAFLTQEVHEFELLESMLLEQGEFFLLERHLERLRESSEYFGFECDEDHVLALLRQTAAHHRRGCWKVRLTQDRNGVVELEVLPLPCESVSEFPAGKTLPLHIKLAPSPVDVNDRFLFHKTTQRSRYQQALNMTPDCDDVILWNEAGEVTESSIANVVVPLDGQLFTPLRESGLLGGTFRAELLHAGTIRERRIFKHELQAAPSFYLINSVRKWMPALLAD